MKSMFKTFSKILLVILAFALVLSSCDISAIIGGEGTTTTTTENQTTTAPNTTTSTTTTSKGDDGDDPSQDGFDLSTVPEYSKQTAPDGYVVINNNVPFFKPSEITSESYEYYGDLDSLGRCTVASACLGKELLPDGERGSITSVTPSGWHSVTYPETGSQSLYNRAHLIAWSLTGEDANEKNLITGTTYMNQHTMQLFENQLLDYIKGNDVHVMYRATPIFKGNNLVASGVLLEAMSVEDGGEDIMFCVYVYNVQEGIIIDYATGESERENKDTLNTDANFDGTLYDLSDFKSEMSSNTFRTIEAGGWTIKSGHLSPSECLGKDVPQVTLNGTLKQGVRGSIQSAVISDGISEIYFNLALCNSESSVAFRVSVLDKDGNVVVSKLISSADASSWADDAWQYSNKSDKIDVRCLFKASAGNTTYTADDSIYTFHWKLSEKLDGEYSILIENASTSTTALKNGNRFTLWNIGWKEYNG